MSNLISDALQLIGAIFLLLAAIGVVRMPDLFTRMQPATKAATLGSACTLLASAVHFNNFGVTTRALAAIAFFLLTAPVTAHLIARAAYFIGVPLWEKTVVNDLGNRYNPLRPGSAARSTPREADEAHHRRFGELFDDRS